MKKLITICNHKLEIELIQANSIHDMSTFHYEVNIYHKKNISNDCKHKIKSQIHILNLFPGIDIWNHNFKKVAN